jgi:hypothetical protein
LFQKRNIKSKKKKFKSAKCTSFETRFGTGFARRKAEKAKSQLEKEKSAGIDEKPVRWHRLFLSPSINGKEVYSRVQKRARSNREGIPCTSDERSAARFEKRNERTLAGSTDVPGKCRWYGNQV